MLIKKLFSLTVIFTFAFFCFGVQVGQTKNLGNEFWDLNWQVEEQKIVKQLESADFKKSTSLEVDNGKKIEFENGKFLEYECNLTVFITKKGISKLTIKLLKQGPETANIYQNMEKYFKEKYGKPLNKDIFFQKSNPPIKIETIYWQFIDQQDKLVEIYLKRDGETGYFGENQETSKIEISVLKR